MNFSETSDQVSLLFETAIHKINDGVSAEEFLDWIEQAGPILAQDMAAQVGFKTEPVGGFFRSIGAHLFESIPSIHNDFQPQAFPFPERNAPCYCASGKKYKQCCINTPKLDVLTQASFLDGVLKSLPMKVFAQLPSSKVDAEMLGGVAWNWVGSGEEKRALALLEPWFKKDVKLDKRHWWLFETLVNLYLDLDMPIKRKRLVDNVCHASYKPLQAEGWMRKASMEIDAGRSESGWEYFFKAQKIDPDNPNIAILEMTLLYNEKRFDEVKSRAKFLLMRFQKNRHIDPMFLDFLQRCQQNPHEIFAPQQSQYQSETGFMPLDELAELFYSAPEVKSFYKANIHDHIGMLKPAPDLKRLEREWSETISVEKPFSTQAYVDNLDAWSCCQEWLTLLKRNPKLWQSFVVLDDLVLILEALRRNEMQTSPLLDDLYISLLERGIDLLLLVKEPFELEDTLPWGVLENRPALRLLVNFIYNCDEVYGLGIESLMSMSLYLELNPDDNHGVRYLLVTDYLHLNQPREAIKLAKFHLDDSSCLMQLSLLLAFFMVNKNSAKNYLRDIAAQQKVALDMLLAKSPKKPEFSNFGIQPGGKDEAWMYRDNNLKLWKSLGALQWLEIEYKKLSLPKI